MHTPRGAAIAGILFALLLSASLLLLAGIAKPDVEGPWLPDQLWIWGLNLIPYAGIAFLWFIGVVRDRIGEYEDRFFATVFLGSGLLFLAMLFAVAAIIGGALAVRGPSSSLVLAFAHHTTSVLMNVFALRMAAVFMITTSTILVRTGILPRWLAYLGYAIALILLVTITRWEYVLLLFPLWVLLMSINMLLPSPISKQSQTR
ncbi:hypothetical protein [Tengunoibacter tsumagoiensis]|uniref:DUF4386 domain-containing protein n=1 Tax=Tengunoibacter tsumagoiensis TaxID=2014871 RepID=A0A402AA87_9CHLR|nr:hypothetical protein [Tengunoibacter tsumagoiensis]GCE15821.1 hypothetical protein KTT_56800 [Tengunoibacter tsumagoiensis]